MTKLDRFLGVTTTVEDWTFADADTGRGLHGLHPYPARMIPQIAHKLIEKYSKRGDIVLDPFCGSGTVVLESRLLGRNSIGIDLNPLAILLARAKSTPIEPHVLRRQYNDLIRKVSQDIDDRRAHRLVIPRPDLNKNLEFWFKRHVIDDLALLRRRLFEIREARVRDFFLACFSLTVRMVSNTRSKEFKLYRIPKDKLRGFSPNVFKAFRKNLEDGIRRMESTFPNLSSEVWAKVILQDTRLLTLDRKVDLALTSPPYGDSRTTVAYGQFSRYPALWCGLAENWHPEVTKKTIVKIDQLSLGGNGKLVDVPESATLRDTLDKIGRRSRERAHDTALFFNDIKRAFERILLTMNDGAHFCIVIGNRTVSRVRVPTDQILVEVGNTCGFKHLTTFYRRIPTKRMPWENAPENIVGERGKTIHEESIIILRKGN